MAANESGLRDEEGDLGDWIEIHNSGASAVDLAGWSLTDHADEPGKWMFPSVVIESHGFLVVHASGKDRTDPAKPLHTNFKLSANGEYVGLHAPGVLTAAASELNEYPEQRIDHSYGRMNGGRWGYFPAPTPGAANGITLIDGVTEPVHFSVERGLYDTPFRLTLHTPTAGAVIRYTLDGSTPTAQKGTVYESALSVGHTMLIRAAAFAPNKLPSKVRTHSYLFNIPASRRTLPIISLVTDTNHLFGRTGIMSTSPRNTTKRGIAWERPVSVEWIRPEDNGGFHIDAGLRVQGGNYVRERYNPRGSLPFSKYSFRLYFRGDYGEGKLRYPVFPNCAIDTFDHIVLRAGMNDHSNPFINDEVVRRLAGATGQVASHGTVALLFINGAYKGYYNPTERIGGEFLQSWHGGGDDWDVMAQFNELREGTSTEWNSLRNFLNTRNLTQRTTYETAERRLDMVNFIDYLLVNIYAATGDWPHNNWRAARERAPGGKFRFYAWDAEWSFGLMNNPVSHNTISVELGSSTDIGNFYRRLRVNPEFRLLFADRAHKHLFNGGALTDTNVLNTYLELRTLMKGVLPNMNSTIERTWVPRRRGYILRYMATAGLLASSNAPAFNQHGGAVPPGFAVTMSASEGEIYYTTNGTDPRVRFVSEVNPQAVRYGAPISIGSGMQLMARTLSGTNWSALTEATFTPVNLVPQVRITELMYNPPGGSAYEFVELQNIGSTAVDLSSMRFTGIQFSFPAGTHLAPGEVLVLSSDENPSAFASRYPGVRVVGTFAGALSNSGETISLTDATGQPIVSVTYSDSSGWPVKADGGGRSLEIIHPAGDPNAPANWRSSSEPGGSPGRHGSPVSGPVQLNELMVENVSAVSNGDRFPDWIELRNVTATTVDLGGWSLTDDSDPRKFVFPPGTQISAGDLLLVWCDSERAASNAPGAGLNTGFNLPNANGEIFLFNASGQAVDRLTYGFQVPDRAVGRSANGDWQLLASPTPGRSNSAPALLGDPNRLRLNEWMADPVSGSDWIELYNADQAPVQLTGLYFTDDASIAGRTNFQMTAVSFIPPEAWVRLHAAGKLQSGADHLDFSLDRLGETVRIYSETGALIDSIDFGPQRLGISEGRLPDGAATIVAFPGSATPGAGNFALLPHLFINEVLTHSDPPLEDAIELFNSSREPVEIGGWYLSDDSDDLRKFRIPPGTVIPANGFKVFYQMDFGNSATPGFFMLNSSRGEEVHLSAAMPDGTLTGFRAVAQFGAAENGVSFGRYETSGGSDFVAMSERTFGVDQPESLREFRNGTGLPNVYPRVGPVVVNEIMYHPVTIAGATRTENTAEEFIELYNISGVFVPLFDPLHPGNTWRLAGGIGFSLPQNITLGPNEFIVIVNFDPVSAPGLAGAFRQKYGLAASVRIYGPYSGKLSNASDVVRLFKPDPPQTNGPDVGFIPYILVDEVRYEDVAPWPAEADGTGASLQRIVAGEYGNDPVNWIAALPTAGQSVGALPLQDSDLDGLPDHWEAANGLDPASAADAGIDSDGDGMTNAAEFRAGTFPRNPSSTLRLESLVASDGSLTLRFRAASGRSYFVEVSDELSPGSWRVSASISAETGGRIVEVAVPGVSPSGGAQFYRLRVGP